MFTPSRPTPGRRAPGSARSSRAGTPGRASPAPFAKASAAAAAGYTPSRLRGAPQSRLYEPDTSLANDADMTEGSIAGGGSLEEGTILLKDDITAVTAFTRLPLEVAQLLEGSDPYRQALASGLSVQTGFAYLTTPDVCYVWNFTARGSVSPICYTFSVPSSSGSSSSPMSLPHCALVSRSSGHEPGLILVSQSGKLAFWNSVVSSGAGADGGQELAIALGAGETITALQQCQASCFAVSTSQSRLFNVLVSSRGGRLSASVAPFAQPRGLFGRLFGSASSFSLGSEGTFALAAGPAPDKSDTWNLFTLGQRVVQKWHIGENGGERLAAEQDLRQMIVSAVFGPDEGDTQLSPESVALEMLSCAVTNDASLAILFAHSPSASGARSFGVAIAELPTGATSFVISSTSQMQYRAHRDPRPNSAPQLVLPHGGPALFVVFPEAVVLRIHDVEFEDVLMLRDSSRNRFLGLGAEALDVDSDTDVASVSLITLRSGALLLELACVEAEDLAQRLASPSERALVGTERLRAKLEQAVFYGDNTLNPVSFELPQSFEGDLITAAERLSSQIVNSASVSLEDVVDLRAQLADRVARLRGLIGFIAQNGLLGKLSQTSRRHLGADAEMLAAAIDLWQYSNAFMNTARQTGISANPLAESIEQVMGDLGEGAGDVARLFFRERLEYLNSVLEEVAARVRAAQGTSIDVRSFEVLEANRILLTAYQAAHRCRKDTAELYRFTPSQAAFEAWTCTAGNIDVLEALFHATEDLLRERTRELGTSVDAGSLQLVVADTSAQGLAQRAQQELKSQLADLAAHALSAFEDRLAYLQAAAGTGSDANTLDRERELLDARYRSARPQMILPLLAVGRQERAFGLAERHRDFRTLTELCHQPSLASGSGEQRIRHYLRLYRKDFAFELYGWYVEQGKLRKLLEQEESESELLLDFLESTDNARIGWLHDIRLARYDEASDKLLRVADAEQGLAEKKLMLSLGKLSHIALLTEQQIATAKEQQAIEVIDDQIDLTNVHQRLLDAFESAVPGAIEGAELSAEPVVDAVAVSLQGLPTLRSLFRTLAAQLLRGSVLSSEDLIDLLTLQDPSESASENFTTALEVFIRTKDLPEARSTACLSSLWLRLYLSDDWPSITDTTAISDDELTERLRSTNLYAALLSAATNGDNMSEAVLDPQDCLEPPSPETIVGRMPGCPAHEVELLLEDLRAQSAQLQGLLEGPTQLRKWHAEVVRLAQIEADESALQHSTLDSDGMEE